MTVVNRFIYTLGMSTKKIAKEVLKKIDGIKGDRTKTSLYLSKATYKGFGRACKDRGVSPSVAIEMLMQGFIDANKM